MLSLKEQRQFEQQPLKEDIQRGTSLTHHNHECSYLCIIINIIHIHVSKTCLGSSVDPRKNALLDLVIFLSYFSFPQLLPDPSYFLTADFVFILSLFQIK